MAGMPIFSSAQPKLRVIPKNASGTYVRSVTIAASKSGDNPGTMDSTPTEAEVVALMNTLFFLQADDVREVDLTLAVGPRETSAVQCVLVRVNGLDDYEDATEMSLYGDVAVVLPNIPHRIVSSVPITRLSIVAAPSGVASGVYTGNRLFIAGRA